METDGLKNFDEAHERERELQNGLRESCPNHESRWILK
jgi:hypothetical protein